MRIALVAAEGSPVSQAASSSADQATRLTSLAGALARQGNRVTIYARKDSRSLPGTAIVAPSVTVEHIAAGPATRMPADELARHIPQFARGLTKRWQTRPPDVVHAHFWTAGLAALAGARDIDVPVVQTFGSLGAAERRHRLPGSCPDTRIKLEASIARSVRSVLASSTEEAGDLRRIGVPMTGIKMVPCGVDTAAFTPDGPAVRRSRRQRLIVVAPLRPEHGLGVAVQALSQVPAAELVIVGGPRRARLAADPGYGKLVELAGSHGVADRLTFTGGLGAQDLAAWLRSADLMVSVAWYDPFGCAAIQAMACGVPVIASAVGGNTDAIVEGTTGMLVPPGRPDLLAQQIRRLLALPVKLQAFGIAAADRAKSRYSWDRIGLETMAAYGHALPATPAPAAAARDEAGDAAAAVVGRMAASPA
jgi:D-inositol-3-phosphate glycosyltransferase